MDTGAAYFEPDELYPVSGFCCQHAHRDKYHIRGLLEVLGVRNAEARHKPLIRVVADVSIRREQQQLKTSQHKVHPNQVSTWKRQAMDGLGAVFSNGADRAGRDH